MERISGFLSHMSFADIFIAIMIFAVASLWVMLTIEEQWGRVNRRRKQPRRARRQSPAKWKFSRG